MVSIIKPGFLGKLGGIKGAFSNALHSVFDLNILTLSDSHGNSPSSTALRNSTATYADHTGVIRAAGIDVLRIQHGRYANGAWQSDDGAGNALHPSAMINKVNTLLDLQRYATAQVVVAGGKREHGGRYYTSALGGTTNGATPLVDVGVTDWVDSGIYRADYGLMLESAGSNIVGVNSSTYQSLSFNSTCSPAPINNSGIGLDGGQTAWTYNDASTGFNQRNYGIVKDTTSYTISRYIFKGGTGSVSLVGGGMYPNNLLGQVFFDIATGLLSGAGLAVAITNNNLYVQDCGDKWRLVSTYKNDTTNFLILLKEMLSGGYTKYRSEGLQLEHGSVATSYMPSTGPVAVRATELGMLKYSTLAPAFGGNGFPHAKGSMFLSLVMGHDLAQHGGVLDAIISIGGSADLLYAGFTTALTTTDGTTPISQSQPANYYANGDTMQYGVEWNASTSLYRLGYRNASAGQPWAWSAWAAYDGAFNDTSLYRFFSSAPSNFPWIVRNNIVQNTPLTTAQWDGYIQP